jgi:F0F1-type ATP synthase beta subunit
MKTWKIIKIVWVVIDVAFEWGYVPSIYEALEIKGTDNKDFGNMDLGQLNKSTSKARKTARKIAEKFTKNT